jgi:thiamine-phosphate pyrophosphorylase
MTLPGGRVSRLPKIKMRRSLDYRLYLVTDRGLSLGRTLTEVVTAAVQGGVTCVQVREKHCDTRGFMEQAEVVKQVLAPFGVGLIVNDRVDVALAVEADGVHLGQRDMPLTVARDIVGEDMVIGISAESVADARIAEKEGADYLGVSPIFATPTKTDTAPPLGLVGLAEIRQQVRLPLVGIGSIKAHNAADVIAHGADGIAVVSAISSAVDIEAAARQLRRRVDNALEQHRWS